MEDGADRRINAIVSDEVYTILKQISYEKSITMTEPLRQAISLLKWHHEARKEGARITIERNGKEYELNFF